MHRTDPSETADPADAWLDCVVIGGGAAGCTATLQLVRSARRVLMIDAGQSRARYIASTHNCPGFPRGISGSDLLQRLRAQLREHAAPVASGTVLDISAIDGGYVVHCERVQHRTRCVIVATGVVDRLPEWDGVEPAILAGVVRLCPVCDAYEARGKRIAVYGEAEDCIAHACYLRTHSADVTALHRHGEQCSAADLDLARRLGITVAAADAADCRIESNAFHVMSPSGDENRFDVVYVALGAQVQSSMLTTLGAARAERGDVIVDAQCETSCRGIFAIGDVVNALNQIAVGFGHAAIAASAVHQRLPRNPVGVRRPLATSGITAG